MLFWKQEETMHRMVLRLSAMCAVLCLMCAGNVAAADPFAPIRASIPGCAKTVDVCVAIAFYVVTSDTKPIQTPAWFDAQLKEANRHFAPIGVGFEAVVFHALPEKKRTIKTRSERDQLGRKRVRKGRITVFVVEQLDNVDEPGEIRGVHWRDRAERKSRWVILSSIAPPIVLAHELGHFFGLPHSSWPGSIMNKSSGSREAFADEENKRMKRRLRAMLKSRELVPWKAVD